jgi:uncharacterized protein YcbK (DUF882 family)
MKTRNFKQEEFSCKCGCGESRISPTVLLICQIVRDHFKSPTIILSGCRCEKHNAEVGGKPYSQHLVKQVDKMSHAADIEVIGVKHPEVYHFLNKLFKNSLGLGLYEWGVHIDDRIDKAYRW